MVVHAVRWGFAAPALLWGCSAVAPVPAAAPPPAVDRAPAAAAAASDVLASDVLELPRPMTSFGAALHGGGIHSYGGYFGEPHAYARAGQSGELLRIDLDGRSIRALWAGEGVQGAQLVSSEHGLVRVGGMRAENDEDEPEQLLSLRDVARFDDATRRWEPLPTLPEARSSHAAVLHQGRLYVLGGWVLSGTREGARFAEHTLVLDLEPGTWRSIAQPFRVRAAGAGVVGDRIAVVGGIDAEGTPQTAVHLLDPRTGAWTRGPDFPSDAFGVAAASRDGVLFASGKDGILYELAEPQGRFRPLAALAFPRFFHQLVALEGRRVVALGGITGMARSGRISHVEVIDLESRAPRVLTWSLRSPSPAKNRQGAAVLGDRLITFGGNRSLAQHDFGPDDFRSEAAALSLSTMRFSSLSPYPVARQTVQTASLDGALLALGGFGHDGQKARAQAEAYVYDAAQDAWQPHRSVLPTPRTQFGLVSRGQDLWVFGGLDYDPSRGEAQSFHHPTNVLRARQGEPFADAGVSLPHARRAFGGAELDGRYVLVGGMADGFAPVSTCDVFDFASSAWSTLPCPAGRISPQLVALDGRLYLAGGSSAGAGGELVPNPALEVFEPATNAWSTLLERIPVEPRHLIMLPYRHALFLYSAQRDDGTVQAALIVPPLGRL